MNPTSRSFLPFHPLRPSHPPSGNSPTLNPQPRKLIVIWRGFGVHFHTNVCGKMYALVLEEDATQFDTPLAAAKACNECNLKPGLYEIADAPEEVSK